MKATPIIIGLALLVPIGPCGCGGVPSSGSGGTGMNEIMWPSREGGPSSTLPPSVSTGRIVFQPQSGAGCCVAVNAQVLSSQQGLAVLTDLPLGPATVTVAGFETGFAPAVPGITETCTTTPGTNGVPCDSTQAATPAFESPPLAVTILAGVQTTLGPVPMVAMPFVLDGFTPAQGADAPAPVHFALTVVDAVTNIRPDSIELEVIFTVPTDATPTGTTPSPFRTLSKRVPLTLEACADGSTTACSPSGSLQVAGFAGTGTAPELPEGQVEAHLTAENLGDPPQQLDFRYPFNVLATPTQTATATPTSEAATPASSAGGTLGEAPSTSAGPSGASVGQPADALAGSGPENGGTRPRATPTATPTPGGAR